jgi:hypothetical protein
MNFGIWEPAAFVATLLAWVLLLSSLVCLFGVIWLIAGRMDRDR